MSPVYVVLCIVYIALSVALVTMVLMQKKGSGLGNMAGMGDSQTYWDKNKGRSLEGSLERYSKICGAALMVLSIIVCIFR